MNVSCTGCGYDSGDREDGESLAAKVNADGGCMEMAYDEFGKPSGWRVACPLAHEGDCIRLD